MTLAFVGLFSIGNKVAEASPQTDRDAKFNAMYNDALKNGYVNYEDYTNLISFPITKLKREIIEANGTVASNKDPQFYMTFTDNFKIKTGENNRAESVWDKETFTTQGKLDYLDQFMKNNSQAIYPVIHTRFSESEYWRGDDYIIKKNTIHGDAAKPGEFSKRLPQGFMYSEFDPVSQTQKIKPFVYEKKIASFKLLWNVKTESMMYLIKEAGDNDKIFMMKTEVDEIYRNVRVTGELSYFGTTPKKFTILNQMAYDISVNNSRVSVISAYEMYGKNRGIKIPNPADRQNIIIRLDTPDKPKSWVISEYPYVVNGEPFTNGRASEANSVANFNEGFDA